MMASPLHAGGPASLSGDVTEAPPPPSANDRRRGGWITTPFITAAVFGLTVAAGGWSANLIVFLINEFNVKRIDAAQINSVVNGCVNFFPLVAAVLADSLLSCFSLIWISSLISLLGLLLLLLTVTVETLKPPPSQPASKAQYALLYSAMALSSIGLGGTRFTLATMGANQLKKTKHQTTFFNWYFFSLYFASFLSSTAVVYVEDNAGWEWGFGIAMAANAVGLGLFLAGARYYRHEERTRAAAPFTGLARVAVAAFRKRKAVVSGDGGAGYYYGDGGAKGAAGAAAPTNWFR